MVATVQRDVQRVTAAVERAIERIVIGAHHRRNADVGIQFHCLSAVRRAVVHVVGERVPVLRRTDKIRIVGSSATRYSCPRRLRHREHHHKQQHGCPSRCTQPRGQGREKVLLNGLTHCCLFLIIFVSSKYAHKKPYGLAEGKAVYVACRAALVRASLHSDV